MEDYPDLRNLSDDEVAMRLYQHGRQLEVVVSKRWNYLPEEFEDSLQEYALKFITRGMKHKYDPSIGIKFSSWNTRCFINFCVDVHRRDQSSRMMVLKLNDSGISESELVGSYLSTRDYSEEFWDSVSELDTPYRDVIALDYGLNLEDEDIAEVLGIKPATVRWRKSKAKRTIYDHLSENLCDAA